MKVTELICEKLDNPIIFIVKEQKTMDFHLSKEHLLVRKMYREFAENEVKPLAEELDEEERFPMETVEKMAKLGMMGIYFPKQYGGAGGDVLSYAMCVEELAKVCGTTAVIVSAHTSLCCAPIFENGTEEQKMKYLPDLLSGRKIGAFGLTEPGAGTDASGQQTTAVKNENGDYVLNGSKCFITNGPLSDYFCVYALTDHELGPKSMATFVVEKNTPGFSIGARHNTMGIRSAMVSELHFNDVHVPVANMVTPPGKGFAAAMKTLDGGRIGIASQALGIAEGAFEIARKYLMQREQFKKPLYKNQHLAFRMVDLANEIEMAKYMVYKAACDKDDHKPFSASAAKAKLIAAETAMHVTTDAVQMLGGNGFMKEYHVERLMRDAKITQIYEGTSEIQKIVLSKKLFV